MQNNPFVTNGYVSPHYFCDREIETERAISFLTNENNIAFISPRRVGKTDLIRHIYTKNDIKENYYTFLVDIYSTRNLGDFVAMLGKSILSTLRPLGRSIWEGFLNILTSIRSEISFDQQGNPQWGIGIGSIQNPELTLDEIFRFLSGADKKCIVAIDEFQQISKYNDGVDVEALLRTYIQKCSNANFIFSGSQRHMMSEIFLSPSRPFYQSVTIMNIPKISLEKYVEFCLRLFAENNKRLEVDVVETLYHQFDGITSYLQKVMNSLFTNTPVGGTCTKEMIEQTIGTLLDISSDSYESLTYQMTEKQLALFQAIALSGECKNISSARFVKQNKLLSASSVLSAAKSLLEKDFITRDKDTYKIYDIFFSFWIKRKVTGSYE